MSQFNNYKPHSYLKSKESQWIEPVIKPQDQQTVQKITRDLGITTTTAQLLVGRHIESSDKAYRFLNPGAGQLHDPFLLKDMKIAAERLKSAIQNREKIMILGDCDTDGTAGAVLLFDYIRSVNGRVYFTIPERETQGYGLNYKTVAPIIRSQVQVVITVDNGCNAMEAAEELVQNNIDLIVTDHHLVEGKLPPAFAIINPHQPGCYYPFKMLSGAGVAFKLISALDRLLEAVDFWKINQIPHINPEHFLDLVALATVADRCPLRNENRSLVKIGLEKINKSPRPGVEALIKACGIHTYISPFVISHKIAPKLNSAGRMNQPMVASKLLLARTVYKGYRLAHELLTINRKRQLAERVSYDIALQRAIQEADKAAIIQISDKFHPGTLSIVASKLAKMFHKPTVLLVKSGNFGVGSARSSEDINLQKMMCQCNQYLEQFGGHSNALGLTIQSNNFGAFKQALIQCIENNDLEYDNELDCDDNIHVDVNIPGNDWTPKMAQELVQMSPFGYRNPEPVLCFQGIMSKAPRVVSKRQQLFEFSVKNQEKLEIVAWDMDPWIPPDKDNKIEMAVSPQIFLRDNHPSLQLRLLGYRNRV